eukprot:TRINITY_DN4241_c0_g1_i2.p1 TRINITY_DN4241_c0_g1~~TRINITY_DN4241_c0_g1_i2.p1  ORF type:complete len:2025 (-),score=383.42 TRINITY_DN4241_c0_g1_i2:34-6108(-)
MNDYVTFNNSNTDESKDSSGLLSKFFNLGRSLLESESESENNSKNSKTEKPEAVSHEGSDVKEPQVQNNSIPTASNKNQFETPTKQSSSPHVLHQQTVSLSPGIPRSNSQLNNESEPNEKDEVVWQDLSQLEKSLVAVLKVRRKGIKDKSQEDACFNCKREFGIFTHRYPCNLCFHSFCKTDVDSTVPSSYLGLNPSRPTTPVRVCAFCAELLTKPVFQGQNTINILLDSLKVTEDYSPSPHTGMDEELVTSSMQRIAFAFDEKSSSPMQRIEDLYSDSKSPPPLPHFPHAPLKKTPSKRSKSIKKSRGMSLSLDGSHSLVQSSNETKSFDISLPTFDQLMMNAKDIEDVNQHESNKNEYLSQLVSLLLTVEQLDVQKWEPIIVKLVNKAAVNLYPKLVDPKDRSDIRNYIKVKVIPGGDVNDSEYVTGLVLEKNRAHRDMKSKFSRPKVMLLANSIQFKISPTQLKAELSGNTDLLNIAPTLPTPGQLLSPPPVHSPDYNTRPSSKNIEPIFSQFEENGIKSGSGSNWVNFDKNSLSLESSIAAAFASTENNMLIATSNPTTTDLVATPFITFDDLLRDERSIVENVVDDIKRINPDILFVQQHVSRVAQELLLSKGICLVVNVKPHTMRILSRICKAPLLTTIPHQFPNQTTFNPMNYMGVACGDIRFVAYEIPDIPKSTSSVTKKVDKCNANPASAVDISLIQKNTLLSQKHGMGYPRKWPGKKQVTKKVTENPMMLVKDSGNVGNVESVVDDNEYEDTENEDNSDRRRTSYAYIQECPNDLFATLMIRGATSTFEIEKIKEVIKFATYASYHLHLESTFISSQSVVSKCQFLFPEKKKEENLSLKMWKIPSAREAISCTPLISFPSTLHMLRTMGLPVLPQLTECPRRPNILITSEHSRGDIDTSKAQHINPLEIKFDYRSVLKDTSSCRNYDDNQADTLPLTTKFLEHQQRITYVHSLLCTTSNSICILHELHVIDFYSPNDLSLGEFLTKFCFDDSFNCKAIGCNKGPLEHQRTFMHNKGRLDIFVKTWLEPEPIFQSFKRDSIGSSSGQSNGSRDISMWIRCPGEKSARCVGLNDSTLRLSFGKYIELTFYVHDTLKCKYCGKSIFTEHTRFYYNNRKVAIFAYTKLDVRKVELPPLTIAYERASLEQLRYTELRKLHTSMVTFYSELESRIRSYEEAVKVDVNIPSGTTTSSTPSSTAPIANTPSSSTNGATSSATHSELLTYEQYLQSSTSTIPQQAQSSGPGSVLGSVLGTNSTASSQQQPPIVNPAVSLAAVEKSILEKRAKLTNYFHTQSQEYNIWRTKINDAINNVANIDVFKVNLLQRDLYYMAVDWNSKLNNVATQTYNLLTERTKLLGLLLTTSTASIPISPSTATANPASTSVLLPNSVSSNASHSPVNGNQPSISLTSENNENAKDITTSVKDLTSVKDAQDLSVTDEWASDLVVVTPTNQTLSSSAEIPKPNDTNSTLNVDEERSRTRFRSNSGGKNIEGTTPITQNLTPNSANATIGTNLKTTRNKRRSPSPIKIDGNTKVDYTWIQRVNQQPLPALLGLNAETSYYPVGVGDCVVPVRFPTEPSTLIAYALTSYEYHAKLKDYAHVTTLSRLASKNLDMEDPLAVNLDGRDQFIIEDYDGIQGTTWTRATVKDTNTNEDSVMIDGVKQRTSKPSIRLGRPAGPSSTSSTNGNPSPNANESQTAFQRGKLKTNSNFMSLKFKQQSDQDKEGKGEFTCDIYYPLEFSQLRTICGVTMHSYCQSLALSRLFDAKGGKSEATFNKTLDDRYILKKISKIEFESFSENDSLLLYFEYLVKVFQANIPTALAKIFGLYAISYKKGSPQFFIVMENLFYKRKITQVYDLKGSMRNRISQEKNQVLLDEDLLGLMYSHPMCVDQESKALLGMSVWNDSLFLASLNVMDYSFLVGIDQENGQFVVGIIDYLRRYTWDKQLESWVKKTSMALGARVPTIISPKQYKKRFRYAIWLYFIMIPKKDLQLVVLNNQNSQQGTKNGNNEKEEDKINV